MLQTLFGFHGRMRRSYYWAVGLVMSFAVAPLGLGLTVPLLPRNGAADAPLTTANAVGFCLLAVFRVAFIWARLAIQVKRWHDRGRSGWWMLIGVLPVIGWLWMFIECGFLDGDPGANKYGPSPKDPHRRPQPATLDG